MKKNIRFIKTKISDDNAYVLLTKCDYCPHFLKDKSIGKVSCGNSFNSLNNDNIIQSDVRFMLKNNNLVVQDSDTLIPEWCTLSDKMKDEMDKSRIVYKSRGFIYKLISPFSKGVDKIIPDVYIRHKYESDELEYNEEGKIYITNQILKKENDKIVNNTNHVTTIPFTNYTKIIDKNICSSCGEDRDDVKRSENDGMCNDCYEKNKFDNMLKYYSFINNFRLKRKSDWSDNKFKIIK